MYCCKRKSCIWLNMVKKCDTDTLKVVEFRRGLLGLIKGDMGT